VPRPSPEPDGAPASADAEAAYYQAVEEYFVARRGDPLFLSNADWNRVRGWRLAGLPLRIVLRGIRDALDGHAHGWSRDRKVKSLAYCVPAVEAAGERWRRALALGGDEGQDASRALNGFASDLERARELGPRGREQAAALARELRARADAGALDEVTAWLAEREARLIAAIGEDLGPERMRALEAEVEASLERWRARMPDRVIETLRRESLARRVLEAHGLPRLSLFHLEGGGAA
jgi:hypothetical protein